MDFSLTRLGSRGVRARARRRQRSRRRDLWRRSRYGGRQQQQQPQNRRAAAAARQRALGSPRRRPSPSPRPPRLRRRLVARVGHRRRATSQCPLGPCGRTRQSPRTGDSRRRVGGCVGGGGNASWGGRWGTSTAIPSRKGRRMHDEEKALAGVREEGREKGERGGGEVEGGASVDRVNRLGLRIYSVSLTAL